jgi:uncharacterized protein (DUF2384 family)
MNIDAMIDQQTVVNYAKTKMDNNMKKAEAWFFNPCPQLDYRRPVNVLSEDLDGFKKCLEAVDKRVETYQ